MLGEPDSKPAHREKANKENRNMNMDTLKCSHLGQSSLGQLKFQTIQGNSHVDGPMNYLSSNK